MDQLLINHLVAVEIIARQISVDGLFKLFTMLETLEHYSLSDQQAFANIAKNQLNL